MDNGISLTASAYLKEYGELPRTREEQDRYNAFRFGFEAGVAKGRLDAFEEVVKFSEERR